MRLPALPLPFSPGRRAAAGASRRGFTLLEIILALGIGALLLAGLYYALDIQINHTHSGRKLVERTSLARGIINRIQSDILASLGPVDPNYQASSQSNASSSSSTSSSTTSSTTSSSTASGTGGTSTSGTNTPQTFNLGVQGTSTQLSIYASRLPREAMKALGTNSGGSNGSTNQAAPLASDLRRITYWLSTSGAGGLARQESTAVTSSDEISNLPPNVANEEKYLIHSQVVSLQFQYFDGTTWQDSWDGTQPGSDGQTPQGPPAAIAITLSITQPGASGPQSGGQNAQAGGRTYQFRHVVPIPTANSYVASTSATTPSGSSGGASSTGGN